MREREIERLAVHDAGDNLCTKSNRVEEKNEFYGTRQIRYEHVIANNLTCLNAFRCRWARDGIFCFFKNFEISLLWLS